MKEWFHSQMRFFKKNKVIKILYIKKFLLNKNLIM